MAAAAACLETQQAPPGSTTATLPTSSPTFATPATSTRPGTPIKAPNRVAQAHNRALWAARSSYCPAEPAPRRTPRTPPASPTSRPTTTRGPSPPPRETAARITQGTTSAAWTQGTQLSRTVRVSFTPTTFRPIAPFSYQPRVHLYQPFPPAMFQIQPPTPYPSSHLHFPKDEPGLNT